MCMYEGSVFQPKGIASAKLRTYLGCLRDYKDAKVLSEGGQIVRVFVRALDFTLSEMGNHWRVFSRVM